MSGPTSQPGIFDVRRIRRLVELMKEHDLSEIDLREGRDADSAAPRRRAGGDGRRRAGGRGRRAAAAAAAAAGGRRPPPPAEDETMVLIKSPMVGTFYSRPRPGFAAVCEGRRPRRARRRPSASSRR